MDAAETSMRLEKYALGTRLLRDNIAYGVQTARAVENFSVSGCTEAEADLLLGDVAAFANPVRTERLIAQFRANKSPAEKQA